MYQKLFKPFIDFIVALIVLVLLSPILIFVILLLISVNRGKPFFIQKRPGRDERIFSIIKFKTMNDKKDAYGNLLPDKYRLTTIGKIIRKTSIDELPQLLNVLKGDMSLIGPRPLLVKYLPYYTKSERLRFKVKPGLTGLAQVNGRNNLSWDKRLAYDVQYVQNLSIKMDVMILRKTAEKIIKSEDIVLDTHSLMLDFDEERKNQTKSINY